MELTDYRDVKRAALSGARIIWVELRGMKGVIFPRKYSDCWWKKATESDVWRVTVK